MPSTPRAYTPLDHAWKGSIGNLEGGIDVDSHNVSNLVLGSVDEVCRHGMRLANVVDSNMVSWMKASVEHVITHQARRCQASVRH